MTKLKHTYLSLQDSIKPDEKPSQDIPKQEDNVEVLHQRNQFRI